MTTIDHRTLRPASATTHRAMSVLTAAAVGLISWIGIHIIGSIDLVVGTGNSARTIGGVDVVVASTIAALLGWGVLVALEHRLGTGRRTMRVWRNISLVVLLASLAGPLAADAATSTQWWLIALHTSVGVAFVASMSWRPRGPSM